MGNINPLDEIVVNGIADALELEAKSYASKTSPLFITVPATIDQLRIARIVLEVPPTQIFDFSDLLNKERYASIAQGGPFIAANYQNVSQGINLAQERIKALKQNLPMSPRSLVLSTCLPDLFSFTSRGGWFLNPFNCFWQILDSGMLLKLVPSYQIGGEVYKNQGRYPISTSIKLGE